MEKVELFQGIDRSSIEAIMNCFKPETRSRIVQALRRMGRPDLIARLYPKHKKG